MPHDQNITSNVIPFRPRKDSHPLDLVRPGEGGEELAAWLEEYALHLPVLPETKAKLKRAIARLRG